jgi:2-polyprenyl-6-hydroxyphenyl methylase/3-demethylubiquinone-9 3-methyltransferase
MPIRSASIAPLEIEQFSHYAEDWWNEAGPLAPLHRLNPVRLSYIRDQACAHFARKGLLPLKGLAVCDVGCGGGLVTEPLARLGAEATGLDASAAAIKIARQHAKVSGLAIEYREGSVEDMAAGKARYDLITALEIAEHVAHLDSFMRALSALLKPGGLLIMSTLNRTPRSFILGIIAAEYVLGWVPRGTHNWKKFLRPSELARRLEACGVEVTDLTGLVFNPMRGGFELRKHDLAVNYMLAATKR